MSAKISICLPNLNHRRFLEERIATIFSQSFQDWELIVCDSYSDDGSWEYFQQFAIDPRVRLYQVPREGLFAGWNECLRRASGEFVYFATADDTARPDLLSRLIEPMERKSDLHLSTCNYMAIDEYGAPLPDPNPRIREVYGDWLDKPCLRFGKTEFLLHACLRPTWVTMTSVLFRRSLLDRTGFFPQNCGASGDMAWAMTAAVFTDMAYWPEKLATWRIHSSQATNSKGRLRGKEEIARCLKVAWDKSREYLPEAWRQKKFFQQVLLKPHFDDYCQIRHLNRSLLKHDPGRFFSVVWKCFLLSPTLLLNRARNGFSWKEIPARLSPSEYSLHVLKMTESPWPPKPAASLWSDSFSEGNSL